MTATEEEIVLKTVVILDKLVVCALSAHILDFVKLFCHVSPHIIHLCHLGFCCCFPFACLFCFLLLLYLLFVCVCVFVFVCLCVLGD